MGFIALLMHPKIASSSLARSTFFALESLIADGVAALRSSQAPWKIALLHTLMETIVLSVLWLPFRYNTFTALHEQYAIFASLRDALQVFSTTLCSHPPWPLLHNRQQCRPMAPLPERLASRPLAMDLPRRRRQESPPPLRWRSPGGESVGLGECKRQQGTGAATRQV